MKEKLVEFLKPDKRKVVLALLLPLIWSIFSIILIQLSNLLRPPPGFVVTMPAINMGLVPLLLFLITYIIEVLFLYPFVCSIILLLDSYKDKRLSEIWRDRGLLVLVLLGVVVFNPISLSLLTFVVMIISIIFL